MEEIEPKEESMDREEICIHVLSPPTDNRTLHDLENNNLRVLPEYYRSYFRYSMYGQSKVVESSSFVYASHHASQSSWLDIRKLSVVLVGGNEIPNLGLFAPTVSEIYFMGHISYPTTAFNMLAQLTSLKTVAFNIGFGGYINIFRETSQQFHDSTVEIPSVTTLEIKLNHQLYNEQDEDQKNIFDSIVKSVLKHSSDSFPNLQDIIIDLPNTSLFNYCTVFLLNSKENLRAMFEVVRTNEKIVVRRKPGQNLARLPFDPSAYFPNTSRQNVLRFLDILEFCPPTE